MADGGRGQTRGCRRAGAGGAERRGRAERCVVTAGRGARRARESPRITGRRRGRPTAKGPRRSRKGAEREKGSRKGGDRRAQRVSRGAVAVQSQRRPCSGAGGGAAGAAWCSSVAGSDARIKDNPARRGRGDDVTAATCDEMRRHATTQRARTTEIGPTPDAKGRRSQAAWPGAAATQQHRTTAPNDDDGGASASSRAAACGRRRRRPQLATDPDSVTDTSADTAGCWPPALDGCWPLDGRRRVAGMGVRGRSHIRRAHASCTPMWQVQWAGALATARDSGDAGPASARRSLLRGRCAGAARSCRGLSWPVVACRPHQKGQRRGTRR